MKVNLFKMIISLLLTECTQPITICSMFKTTWYMYMILFNVPVMILKHISKWSVLGWRSKLEDQEKPPNIKKQPNKLFF